MSGPAGSPGQSEFAQGTHRFVQALFGRLDHTADLLGEPGLLDGLRDRGRAVDVAPSAWGDQPDLRAAAQELLDAVHQGVPLLAGDLDDLVDLVRDAGQSYQAVDQAAAQDLSTVQASLERVD